MSKHVVIKERKVTRLIKYLRKQTKTLHTHLFLKPLPLWMRIYLANLHLGNQTHSVDCGATTHVTDMSKFTKFDDTLKPDKHFVEFANGTRANNVALKRGDVDITIIDCTGTPVKATLQNALSIPSYPQDIFSVQAETERDASVTFQPDSAMLTYKDGTKFIIEKHSGRLYYLNTYDNITDSDTVNCIRSMNEWHQILGHCNYDQQT